MNDKDDQTRHAPAETIPARGESYSDMIAAMTPAIYDRLKTAVELGKWENGDRLSAAQIEHCLQAIIAYDHQHLPETQRVGYIDRRNRKDATGNAGKPAGENRQTEPDKRSAPEQTEQPEQLDKKGRQH